LVVITFCSCEEKEPKWDIYRANYHYVAAYFDEPLDLNWDGVKHYSLYDELPDTVSCNVLLNMLRDMYAAKIMIIKDNYSREMECGIEYREPEWWYYKNEVGVTHTTYGCYSDITMEYSFILEGNNLIPTGCANDYLSLSYPDMQLSEIQSMKIENDTLKIHVLKPFFTSDTIFQTVNAYFHFVKSF